MTDYLRNPLTYAWAFLTAVTLVSWWISRGTGGPLQLNTAITLGVLLIAVVKVHLVIRYFMEVRHAPAWLKRVTFVWLLTLFLLLSGTYLMNS